MSDDVELKKFFERVSFNMGKFKEKIYRFMYGRYGTDKLYNFTFVLTLILLVAELVVNYALPESLAASYVALGLSLAVVGLYVWMVFRSMSRNIYKRRKENERFLKAVNVLKRLVTFNTSRKTKSHNRDDAMYIFRDCTRCGSTLRLPRKKGRHKVKCPKCTHRFFVTSK